jgi:putative flavoprotein involved in K+ transport
MPPPPPFIANVPEALEINGLGTVIFACGYRPDYTSWISFPEAFDDLGFPIQEDGSSTIIHGLHFMGVHFQRKRKSATFLGVAEDAAVLAETVIASNRSS